MALTLHLDASEDPVARLHLARDMSSLVASNDDLIRTWDDVSDATARAATTSPSLGTDNAPLYKIPANGINGLSAAYFDGSISHLAVCTEGGAGVGPTGFSTLDDVFNAAAKTLFVVFQMDANATNNATPEQNDALIADAGIQFGITVRTNAGVNTLYAFNADGAVSIGSVSQTFSQGEPVVARVRHNGTTLALSLNGGLETTVASGTTFSMTANVWIGVNFVYGQYANVRIGEIKCYDTADADGNLDSETDALIAKWGAESAIPLQKVTQVVLLIGTDEYASTPPSVSACTGGGTVATGSNPTDGTSLATATSIHVWMEGSVGGTTYRWSPTAINHTTAKEPRVDSWGTYRRALPDERGGFEASSVSVLLLDGDNVLRGLHSTQTLRGTNWKIYAADEATIRSGGTPRYRFAGECADFRPVQGGKYRLIIEDPLSRAFSAEAQETLLPRDLISVSDGNADQGLRESPAPVIYGSLSDEDEDEPVGTIEAPFIATETVPGHAELGNLHKHLICISPTHNVQSVFLADPASGDPPISRSKAGDLEYGTMVYVPHQTGWFLATDYSVEADRRWTYLYLDQTHPAANPSRQGRIPITVNVCAREATGDATGNTITNPALIASHLLNTVWAQTVEDDDWPAQATRDGFSILDTDRFAAVATICTGRGYVWAFMLGHSYRQVTLRSVLEQFVISGDFEPFITKFGQVGVTMLDRTSAFSSATALTAEADILEESFEIDPKADAVENYIRYVYRRNYLTPLHQPTPEEGARLPQSPFKADWLSDLQTVSDSTSILALGGSPKGHRESQVLEMEFVRDQATADNLAAQRLAKRKNVNGRAEASFDLMLQKADGLELGDVVKVTHPQGLGASGWSSQRCQVRAIEEDWNTMTARVTVLDVHDLLDVLAWDAGAIEWDGVLVTWS